MLLLDEAGQPGEPCEHNEDHLVAVLAPVVELAAASLEDGHTTVAPGRRRRQADVGLVEVAVGLAAADTAAEEEQVVELAASGSVDLADSYSFIIPIARKLRYALSLLALLGDREGYVR